MKKILFLVYGIASYIVFLAAILYAIGFAGNLVIQKTIDGSPRMPLAFAFFNNASLLLLFALQHTVIAGPAFKAWWIRTIPTELKRSSFVLLSSLCLLLLMRQWQPVGGTVWSVEDKAARGMLHIAYLTGWSIVFISTFLINHFDLFGLRQVWLYFTGKPYALLPFRTPDLYRLVRHPLYMGFLVVSWAAPVMTITHLLFAILTTLYIVTTIRIERKEQAAHSSQKYINHKESIQMGMLFFKRRRAK